MVEENIIKVAYCKSCETYNFNFHNNFKYCPDCGKELEQRSYRRIK